MSRRIDIELTSALPDNSWTWRAAGAKQPKGTLDGSILSEGAAIGDVVKVEIEQEIDGITVLSVVGGRPKPQRSVLELLPSEREFQPVIETRAKRDRNDRSGGRRDDGDRRPRRDRGDGPRGRGDGPRGRGDGPRGRGDGPRESGDATRGSDSRRDDDRGGRRGGGGERGHRRGPSFTPPPEVPQRPKPKRLKPGKANRTAVLAELPEEQRSIAELALQGLGAVRQRLKEENTKAAAEGRAIMPEATVLKLAEDMLPTLRVAEWRDRAEAALRQIEHLDLRDLRSVVVAASDPIVSRDESTRDLATRLSAALTTKQEQELLLWYGDIDAAMAVGRVIRALRLSSQPPKAGVPFPTDIAQRLADSANASLAPMDPPERWIAMLEAAAFSPIRTTIAPARKPDQVNDELLATVRRLAPALPQVAALFEIEVDPKAPMPKPLRMAPRKGKNERPKAERGPKPTAGGPGADNAARRPKRRDANATGDSPAAAPAAPVDDETRPDVADTASPAGEDAAAPADATPEPEATVPVADEQQPVATEATEPAATGADTTPADATPEPEATAPVADEQQPVATEATEPAATGADTTPADATPEPEATVPVADEQQPVATAATEPAATGADTTPADDETPAPAG